MRLMHGLVLLVGTWGCGGPQGGEANAPTGRFALDSTPALLIGVTDGDPLLMFHRASSARRYPDGRIVVADGASRQLRWFGADGTPVQAAGRRGEGPGEFAGPMRILPWAGDTVAAMDGWLRRVSLWSGEAREIRTEQVPGASMLELPAGPWIFRRTVVHGATPPEERGCVAAVLQALPLPTVEAGLRFVTIDDRGRLWVRTGPDGRAEWHVLDRQGQPLGRAPVAPSFDLLQVGEDFVLGRIAAEDGTERIAFHGAADERPSGECMPNTMVPSDSLRPPHMTRQLRNLMVAQEATFADEGKYTTTVPAKFLVVEEGLAVWIFRADLGGWMAAVYDLASELSCAVSVGDVMAGSWRDGVIICG